MYVYLSFKIKTKRRKSVSKSIKKIILLDTTFVCLERTIDWEIKTNSGFSDELHIGVSFQIMLIIGINAIHSRYRTPPHSENIELRKPMRIHARVHPSSLFLFRSFPPSPPLNHPPNHPLFLLEQGSERSNKSPCFPRY